MKKKLRYLIADKQFYTRVLMLALPIMLQQGISNTVSLFDSIMVSSLGDNALAGVSIVGQIFFVLGALFIGTSAGAGIYIVQFFGAGNKQKMRESFLARGLLLLLMSIIAIVIIKLFGKDMIALFLPDSPEAVNEGVKYLNVMIYTIIPFAIINLYASTYRENKHTVEPMIIGIIAIFVNLIFNYLLIEGHFGFPRLGVEGAAIATLLSRIVEALILMIVAHKRKYPFADKVYRNLHISGEIMIKVLMKTIPLMVNELFWSLGMITLNFAYSNYGLTVVNALSIASTINNLFFIIFGGLATSISIIIGAELGANRMEDIKRTAARLITFGVVVCWGFGLIMGLTAPFTPKLFTNIHPDSQNLATEFMIIAACFLWVYCYNASCFFILRAGGSTISALIFDSFFTWLLPVPTALLFIFVFKDNRPRILELYIFIQCLDFVKVTLGSIMIKRGKWIRNLTTVTNEV
jgi:putative MATE family efflux protein